MHPPRLLRPLRPLLQSQLPVTVPRTVAAGIPRAALPPLRTYASVTDELDAAKPSSDTQSHAFPIPNVLNEATPADPAAAEPPAAPLEPDVESDGPVPPGASRMPRALEALYLKPLRRVAEYGVPSCDLQLRSYSARNLEFFCDFALRAAYYAGLPTFGPVPLPRIIERWTVPKSTFIFKKSQENFERITLRRLIQIRDGNPESVQLWLAFLQKHAYYGVGMKANVWEFSKLGVGKEMDKTAEQTEKLLEDKWYHLAYLERRPEFKPKNKPLEKLPAAEDVEELLAAERRRISGGR